MMRRRNWPIYIVACHRSGSTLLRYLIDAHPCLACPPESKFMAGLEAAARYPQVAVALKGMGASQDCLLRGFRHIAEALLGGYAREHGKRRWADKTPNYYRILPFIDRVFRADVLYVFLARHPLDCVQSLCESPYLVSGVTNDPEILRASRRYGQGPRGWAAYWSEVNRTLRTFAAAHEQRCFWLRYEDLVTDPSQWLGDICKFLDEDFDPGMLSAVARVKRSGSPYADWKISETTAIHRDSVGRWRGWPTSLVEDVWPIVSEVAEGFGYSIDVQKPAGCTSAGASPMERTS